MTYLRQKCLEPLALDRLGSPVEVAQQRQALHPRTPDLPPPLVIQIPLHLIRHVGDSHNSQLRVRPHHPSQHLLEDPSHMAPHRLVAGDSVQPRVIRPAVVDGALHRDREPAAHRQPALPLGPPPELARVGDDDADPVPVPEVVGLLVLDDGPSNGEDRAPVHAARAADDAVGDDA